MRYYALWGKKGYAVMNDWDVAVAILQSFGKGCNTKKFKSSEEANKHALKMYLQFDPQNEQTDNNNGLSEESILSASLSSDFQYHVIVSKSGFGIYNNMIKLNENAKYFGKGALDKVFTKEDDARKYAKEKYNSILDKFDYEDGYYDYDANDIKLNKHYYRKQLSKF